MMTFRDFTDDHSNGTYVSLRLSKESQDDVVKFLEKAGITNYDEPHGLHITITYSRKPCPDVRHLVVQLPVVARPTEWHTFPTRIKEGKCLVMKLDCPDGVNMHNDIKQVYGATYDYPEYKPHLTVCYEYNKDELPSLSPTSLVLTFDRLEVKGLDPTFTPTKKG